MKDVARSGEMKRWEEYTPNPRKHALSMPSTRGSWGTPWYMSIADAGCTRLDPYTITRDILMILMKNVLSVILKLLPAYNQL